jgi:hypothetical protein
MSSITWSPANEDTVRLARARACHAAPAITPCAPALGQGTREETLLLTIAVLPLSTVASGRRLL